MSILLQLNDLCQLKNRVLCVFSIRLRFCNLSHFTVLFSSMSGTSTNYTVSSMAENVFFPEILFPVFPQ